MRVFIAVDIDDVSMAAVEKLQKKLKEAAGGLRAVTWVRPEAMHLTLKFLGEIDDQKVVEVCNIVKAAAAENESFELDVEGVGSFGGRSARVLWIGTGRGNDKLTGLAEDIEQRLEDAGFPPEGRKFTGHLTLCRIKNAEVGFILAQTVDEFKDFRAGTVFIDAVTVYQSQLTPEGAVYMALGRFQLGRGL